jgi:hypothetical protein
MPIGQTSNPFRGAGFPVPAYNKTAISGASADTAVKAGAGVVRGVMVNAAGAASSTISVYDGSVAGTAFAVIDGTQVGRFFEFDANCATSIHVKTVDSGGTLRLTVLWM